LQTTPSCIFSTISSGKSTSNSNSWSIGNGPWGSSPYGGPDPVSLPGGAIKGGVDGADARVLGFFLCMCFEFDTLTLAAEWSS
jgi:hypothetical protein